MTISISLMSLLMFSAATVLSFGTIGGLILMSRAEGFKEAFTYFLNVVIDVLAVAALIYVGLVGVDKI